MMTGIIDAMATDTDTAVMATDTAATGMGVMDMAVTGGITSEFGNMLTASTIESWDERRQLVILDTAEEAVRFAAEHWIHSAQRAIQQRGRFAVALSGGATPKAVYQMLSQAPQAVDWGKIFLFWSDERAVPPDHVDSNYRMAMHSGLQNLPIPKGQIFRMAAETNIENGAIDYEEKIHHYLGKHLFDLVMLGVGEDGHTASLFPGSRVLEVEDQLVTWMDLPAKGTRRMTLTFSCINQSAHAAIYAIGSAKREIVPKILNAAILSPWPASRIGTLERPALWILDKEAASCL